MEFSNRALFIAILCIGFFIAFSPLVKALFAAIQMPPLVGWIVLGIGTKIVITLTGNDIEGVEDILVFLSHIGVSVLLFRIGLESKIDKLIRQLGKAGVICFFNIAFSGIIGFCASYFVLDISFLASFVIGIALTATSVGVTVTTWKDAHAIDTPQGDLLIDIAELDDASSILFLGLTLSLLPVLKHSGAHDFTGVLTKTTLIFVLKIGFFIILCLLFSRYIEKPLTHTIQKIEPAPDLLLTIIAVGLIIAAVAGFLGFSMALGAFFAGLAFSRDPTAIKEETSFSVIYDLFCPFFFITIGYNFSFTDTGTIGMLGGVLTLAAIIGKFLGTILPASFFLSRNYTMVLGLSMIPRAEITLIIMEKSISHLEEISSALFSAMVVTSILTCIIASILVKKRFDTIHRSSNG
jgi:Kef-type K+ transport system membrane component KefB